MTSLALWGGGGAEGDGNMASTDAGVVAARAAPV